MQELFTNQVTRGVQMIPKKSLIYQEIYEKLPEGLCILLSQPLVTCFLSIFPGQDLHLDFTYTEKK